MQTGCQAYRTLAPSALPSPCRALKSSQGQLALEHYSKALQQGHPPSIPFAAVLYANRAAARQSLGQHTEAMADCLRATALKPDYAKVCCKLQ